MDFTAFIIVPFNCEEANYMQPRFIKSQTGIGAQIGLQVEFLLNAANDNQLGV